MIVDSPIAWETPRNGYGTPDSSMRLGTVAGSSRQYLMQAVPDGWVFATREREGAPWEPFPLTAGDYYAAVAHRVAVLAAGPSHPDALTEAIDADPATVDALAEVIHEGDWMMAGGEWRFCEATHAEKDQSRRLARAVLLTCVTAHETDLPQAVEQVIREQWATAPRHGAPRRIAAKADKAGAWLGANSPAWLRGVVDNVASARGG